jgi:Spy/CpxP family protein refolding chaperone
MTKTVKRISLGLGTGLIALGITAAAHAFAQNTNQTPGPFSGRGMMGPGGPGRGGQMGPGSRGGPGGPMGMLPMLAPRLGLTDTQRDQIKNIAESHRGEWNALAARARVAHQALNEAVTADAIDEPLIRQRSADVAAVEADVAIARAHAHAEVLQLLTDDQKARLKTRQTQMKDRMTRRQTARGAGRD